MSHETIQQFQIPPCPNGFLYTIRPGDTFYLLAQRFNVSLPELLAANTGVDPERLQVGQQVCIPVQPPPATVCPREVEGFVYTVLPGDTLNEIAERFGITVQQILSVNPQITNPALIFIGQRICIPRPGVRFPCCLLLYSVPNLGISLPLGMGSILIQDAGGGNFALTYSAVGLPDPTELGNYDAYIGSVSISAREQVFTTVLDPTRIPEQIRTWCGSRLIAINPQSPENIVNIRAFNTATGSFGPIILRNFIGECA